MTSALRRPLAGSVPNAEYTSGSLTLTDLTLYSRSGRRGAGVPDWLTAQGLPRVNTPNRIEQASDQRWVMALSKREFWILDSAQPATTARPASHAETPGVWPLYCQHSHVWWRLSGDERALLMAKLCGVDLRDEAFPEGHVAQTQMARVSVIIAHHRWQDRAGFSLFLDQSLAAYAWSALEDAMQEFGSL